MTPRTAGAGPWSGEDSGALRPGEWVFRFGGWGDAAISLLNPRGIPSLAAFESSPWSAELGIEAGGSITRGAQVVLSLSGPGFEHRLRGRVDALRDVPAGRVAVMSGTTRDRIGLPFASHAAPAGVLLCVECWAE